MQISAKTKKNPDVVTIEYDLPETLADLISKFGEKVVESAAKGSLVITVQAAMRRMIEKGKNTQEIQDAMATFTPSAREVSKASAFDKASAQIGKLSPEERRALVEKLQAM